jgi:hypothetical protein
MNYEINAKKVCKGRVCECNIDCNIDCTGEKTELGRHKDRGKEKGHTREAPNRMQKAAGIMQKVGIG